MHANLKSMAHHTGGKNHVLGGGEMTSTGKSTSRGVSRPRILIVEDDVCAAHYLFHIVRDLGIVSFAGNGEEAVSLVREYLPDIVLLDAIMPGMSGYEVCRIIKDDPKFFDLPILFVTGLTDVASETRGLEAGAVDFISKPPNPPIVRARVKSQLALKRRSDQLHRLASLDRLTGLANRRAFDVALEQELRRACRSGSALSLIMADIDHFKCFNDRHGHLAGDDCLRMVAAVLTSLAKRPGEVAARYGGEEFAVILPACDMESALHVAEMIREAVSKMRVPAAEEHLVTVSIGVASHPGSAPPATGDLSWSPGACRTQHGNPAKAVGLVRAADAALYEAKRGGRNKVVSAASPG